MRLSIVTRESALCAISYTPNIASPKDEGASSKGMGRRVNVVILTGFGLNCEKETAIGFTSCGAVARLIHLNDFLTHPNQIHDYHILAFIGGFSFGDHLGAGTVLANRLKYKLGSELKRYITDGRLIIGICNGFQTIVRLGLVPNIDGHYFLPQVALAPNDQGIFRDDWVTLVCNPLSPCKFTKGLDSLSLPIRHGEGKFVTTNKKTLARIEAENLVAMRYADPETMKPTDRFPLNPNGSINSVAGICDPSGRIFGLMPHPEAYLSPFNHPHWMRQKLNNELPNIGMGKLIFQNAVEFAAKNCL